VCWEFAIQHNKAFGFSSSRFGFDIVGTPNIPLKIEATDSLNPGKWAPILTTTINAEGTCQFTDPDFSTKTARFYRIQFP